MNNLDIEFVKQTIINDINNSGLPVGVALLIMKDLTNSLEVEYKKVLEKEYKIKQEESEKEDEING